MRSISQAIPFLIAVALAIQSGAAECSRKCRFSSGSVKCGKGKPECRCSFVETFEGTCGGTPGTHLSLNATTSQLNDFERVIENLKIDHELALVVDGMRNILEATKKRDVEAYISSTKKVNDAINKLSPQSKDKLHDQIVEPRYSAGCVSSYTDLTGGSCYDSECDMACVSVPPTIAEFPSTKQRVDFASLALNSSKELQPTADECRKLFAFALRMPLEWDRVATEKNVVTILSRSDPELAMQLFARVEKPLPIHGIGFPEDVRAYAAIEIFENYWKAVGIKGLGKIRDMARHIGETGEYPYRAMSFVMNQIIEVRHEDGLAIANEVLNEALRYYRRGSKFLNRDEEFFVLIESASHFVAASHYLPALRLFIRNLLTNRVSNGHFIAEIGTLEGSVQFKDMNLALLFRAFPLVTKADSGWADLLMLRYPELKRARSKILYVAAGIVYGETTTSLLVRLQNEVLQESLIENIKRAQTEDSPEVLQMRKRLVALRSALSEDLAVSADDVEAATEMRENEGSPRQITIWHEE